MGKHKREVGAVVVAVFVGVLALVDEVVVADALDLVAALVGWEGRGLVRGGGGGRLGFGFWGVFWGGGLGEGEGKLEVGKKKLVLGLDDLRPRPFNLEI